jgi:cell division protein FtsN
MSRDFKGNGSGGGNGRGNPMGVGILIGLLLGISLALGVALYINKGAIPFAQKQKPAEAVPKVPAQTEGSKPAESAKSVPSPAEKPARGSEGRPRFDFYKILPGTEEAVTDKEFKRPAPAAAAKDVYFLQVAAFQNPSDADNLKARLALAGIEAQIQTATLPDGKIWHRVRVGPFSSPDELSKTRSALKDNKLEANLIKVREPGR